MTNLLLALVLDRLDKISQVTEEILLQLIHRFIDAQLKNRLPPITLSISVQTQDS